MNVLKFGGTSVGSIESLTNVKKIVESIPGKAVVVVSALGGLTDKLIATAKMAAENKEEWHEELLAMKERHLNIIRKMIKPELQDELTNKILDEFTQLERYYQGVYLLRFLPEQVLDMIVSFGERISSRIVAAMVKNGKRYYSPDFIKTEKWYGKNIADVKLTESLIRSTFSDMGEDEKAIVPGFISSDTLTGDITNLGRGGSDYTGALIAAALDAEVLEIWTDVDGFMTADPRIVKKALIINHLTFTESMELCNFGAKVIYPPTIYPVFHKNIPIRILNTFNPKAPGTLITDERAYDDFEVKGVTSLKDVTVINIATNHSANFTELSKRAYNVLSKEGVRIIPVSNNEAESKIVLAVTAADAKMSMTALEKEFAPEIGHGEVASPEIINDLTAIAVVGKSMKTKERLANRIHHSLHRQQIGVEAHSTGHSDTTLIYIINQEKSLEALPLIHSLIF